MLTCRVSAAAAYLVAWLVTTAHCAEGTDHIVVVGDLHGDMAQTLRVLRTASLISSQPDYYQRQLGHGKRAAMRWFRNPLHFSDGMPVDPNTVNRKMVYNKRGQLMSGSRADTYHWAGGNTKLVIVGDAFNIGPDDMDIAVFIKRLAGEAERAGGELVFILGNHELQNLQGNYMGTHPWSFERSGGRDGRTHTLSMRTHLGRFLRSRPILHVDRGLIFVHGGITAATAHRLLHLSGERSLDRLVKAVNDRARRALESWTSTPSGTPTGRIHDPLARFVLNYDYAKDGNSTSPTLVHPLDKCDEVIPANELLGVDAQVVGHTPHPLPEYDFCHGGLLAVDFGMSQWKGGEGAAVAALVLERGPRRHNHTFGPERGALGWHTSLVLANSPLGDDETPESAVAAGTDWRSFAAAVVLAVVAVELMLLYIRRCCRTSTEAK